MIVSYEERDENHIESGRMIVGDQTLPTEKASEAPLLQLQYAAEHCHKEGQYLRIISLIACSE